ncbi:MAG: phospho-sugar mutase [Clostridiaceae bacterium]
MNYLDKYNKWIESDQIDNATKEELKNLTEEKEIEDRFYKDLEFGTGGLRGIIAAGSNRMNIYTVGKATQGLAYYLLNNYTGNISVCISYDSRIMSREFSETCAGIFCANGINVHLFESLRPTPMLSYAVRHLKSKAGIMVTASHNPKQYNGYKVYGDDGGQVTDDDAREILSFINKIEDFSDIKTMELKDAIGQGLLCYIGEETDRTYYEKVKGLTVRKDLVKKHADELKIIYTPIHGSGNIPVRRVLSELGYGNVYIVKEQEQPDGSFPTAPYPNPENPEVFSIALRMAEEIKPDIIFGTDPDCDRIGLVVSKGNGQYQPLTGNQTGVLLAEYMLSALKENNLLKPGSFIVKTIVTTEMIKKITDEFGVRTADVLTGFKYIGEMIKDVHDTGKGTFIFGFEESYGYLAGDFVRDKDAVITAMLICEMALYYKTKGLNLYEALMGLFDKYGYFREKLINIEMEGKDGQEKIQNTLEYLRHSISCYVGDVKIAKKMDYMLGIEKDLPKTNTLKFVLEDDSTFVVRPSGTEPKMKIYLSVKGSSLEDAEARVASLEKAVMDFINYPRG